MSEIFNRVIRDEIIKLRQSKCQMKLFDMEYEIEESISLFERMVDDYLDHNHLQSTIESIEAHHTSICRNIDLFDSYATRCLMAEMIPNGFHKRFVIDFITKTISGLDELYARVLRL